MSHMLEAQNDPALEAFSAGLPSPWYWFHRSQEFRPQFTVAIRLDPCSAAGVHVGYIVSAACIDW